MFAIDQKHFIHNILLLMFLMFYWKTKAKHIRRLFYKKIRSQQSKFKSNIVEFYLDALIEYLSHFEQSDEKIHLQNVIQCEQITLSQSSLRLFTRIAIISILVTLFAKLYNQSYDLVTLKSAIEYNQKVVDLTSIENLDRVKYLNNLNNHLNTRYAKEEKQKNFTQTIKYNQKVVDVTSIKNSNRVDCFNNFNNHLNTRYAKEEKQKNFTQTIKYNQKVVDLTSIENFDRVEYLNNLNSHLNTRYVKEEKQKDFTQTIKYNQEVVDLTSIENLDRVDHLNNLNNRLNTRYAKEEKQKNLTQTIKYNQKVVDLTSIENFDRVDHFNNLNNRLNTRYAKEEKQKDFTQTIKYNQEVVDLTSIENFNRVEYFKNLNNHLNTRYAKEKKQKNLTQAIKYNQEVVDLTSIENFDQVDCFNNFNNHLNTRYEKEEKQKNFTQAIEYNQEVVDLTSIENFDRVDCFNNLNSHLNTRYEKEKKQKNFTQAIEYNQIACKCLSNSSSQRFRDCQNTMNFLIHSQKWFEARETIDHDFEILSLLISNLNSKLDQENMMKSIFEIATMNCAILLKCNNENYNAIKMLKMSRETINRSTINSRVDTSTLFRVHSNLVKRFENFKFLINVSTKDETSINNTSRSKKFVVSKLKKLISKIRTKVKFENFQSLSLKHKLFDTLLNQITILLNTTHFRTNAFLIHNDKRIQILSLNQFIFRCFKDNYDNMCDKFEYNSHKNWNKFNKDMQSFLKWLWDQIIESILHAFNLESLKFLSKYKLLDDLLKRICFLQQRQTNLFKNLDANKLTIYQNLMQQHLNITNSNEHFQTRSKV